MSSHPLAGLTVGDALAIAVPVGCVFLAAVLGAFGFLIRRWIGNPIQQADLAVWRSTIENWQRGVDSGLTALIAWSRFHVEVTHQGGPHPRRHGDPPTVDYRPMREDESATGLDG